ncbi:MAG: PD-(D/E)XK nuclease family protein [Candidatus Moranbacteria bacterium]|nr:PD-(D/E)XK nuclease family protein [Candidatus Moranbacteria bacterium]
MRLSYSSLDTYQSCPLKYKFREIDRLSEPKSKEAVFGTLIHAVMKYIHTPSLLPPSLEQALDYFAKGWNSEVYKDEMEERAAFSQGVSIIQQYYAKNRINEYTIVDLESRFSIEIGTTPSETHTISGIIDRIDKTKDGYEIIDYKTTRKMPSQDKVDNDLQLSVYLTAFLSRYPKEADRLETITVSLYYLKHGVKLSSTRTKEQLADVEKTFFDTIHAITEKKFDPLLSPLCDWCGYQKICPLWKHKFVQDHTVETQEAKQAIDDYIILKAKIGEEKIRLGALQTLILQYMEQEKIDRVFSDQGIIGKTLRKTYAYDEEKLQKILEPLDKWEDVLKVDGIALRNILAALPSATRKEVEATKTINKESTSLSVKRNKIEVNDDLTM